MVMLLYSISMYVYGLVIFIASFFNGKAKAWISGRKNIFNHITEKLNDDAAPRIWFHCSSFGEFEQGRPVLQQLKKQYPDYKIVLTFFSPSGYAQGFKEPAADYVFYLPLDTVANAIRFLSIVKPSLAVFVKYDFWFNYMASLHKLQVPFVYISAIFRANHYFFKWYGAPFLRKLKTASHFFVQNELSQRLLAAKGIHNVTITGDTRFDRVIQLPGILFNDVKLHAFVKDCLVIIGGSTWLQDEELLLQYIRKSPQVKLILVPHEIHNEAIDKLIVASPKGEVVRYTHVDTALLNRARVLIVDTIGMLSKVYRYGHIAYIGGGFGKGIHNTLEAAVYGLPVLFGPNYAKFNEAKSLIENKGAWSVYDSESLTTQLNLLVADANERENAGTLNKQFVQANAGATQKIMAGLNKYLTK